MNTAFILYSIVNVHIYTYITVQLQSNPIQHCQLTFWLDHNPLKYKALMLIKYMVDTSKHGFVQCRPLRRMFII